MLKRISLFLIALALLVACAPSPAETQPPDAEAEPLTVHIFDSLAQSNYIGLDSTSIPTGIPLAAVRMWNWTETDNVAEEHWTTARALSVRDVSGKCGPELQFGLDLTAANQVAAIVKVATSSTKLAQWLPTDTNHANLHDKWATQITATKAELASEYPGQVFYKRWLLVMIGESDSSHSSDTDVWIPNFQAVVAARQAVWGAPYDGVFGVRTRADSGATVACATLRAAQAALFNRYVDGDDLALRGDNVHYTDVSRNIIGARLAAAWLDLWRNTGMLTHGTATRTGLCDFCVDRLDAGAGNGKIKLRAGATVLATVTLPKPAMSAASGPSASLLGVPLAFTGAASGDADNFQATDSTDVVVFAGSVTATGLGGDLTVANVTIANGQAGQITGGSYTAPP
jgi:hypothetical protein